MTAMLDGEELDLDAAKAARTATCGKPFPLRFGGEVVCMLPAELPLDALEPLTEVDIDLTWLVRTVYDAWTASEEDAGQAQKKLLDTVLDMLLANPQLPRQVKAAISAIGRRVLSDDGYERFMDHRPSIADVSALVRGLSARYRVRLGESSTPSDSSESGGHSSTTSPTTTPDSTFTESGEPPESPDSSASADSSSSASNSPTAPA